MIRKPKIAFCLHGLSYGTNFKAGGLPVTFEQEFLLYKDNFIDVNECTDVFFHTWDSSNTNQVIKLYNPIRYSVENTRIFKKTGLKGYADSFKRVLLGNPSEPARLNNIYSRWYSLSEAINCALEYERETSESYDYFFISRFDMSLLSKLIVENSDKVVVGDWKKFVLNDGVILNDDEFYSSAEAYRIVGKGFPYDKEGLSDLWILADRNTALKLKGTFNELDNIVKKSGLSNHKILEYQLRDFGVLDCVCKKLEFGKDYALTRWLS